MDVIPLITEAVSVYVFVVGNLVIGAVVVALGVYCYWRIKWRIKQLRARHAAKPHYPSNKRSHTPT